MIKKASFRASRGILLLLAFSTITLCQISTLNEKGEECFSDDSDYHCVAPGTRHLKEDSLMFITPWNRQGYKLAVKNANKLDMVSPVWFYLEKSKTTGKFEFQGPQDINTTLLTQLREANSKVKILPRFYVSALEEEFRWFLQKENTDFVFTSLLNIAKTHGLDGFVFDIPLLNRLKYKGPVKNLLDRINSEMSHLYKVVTFAGYRTSITQSIEEIEPYLSVFEKILVCTYDYPNKTFDRWLAPVNWVIENINFYTKAASQLRVPTSRFMMGLPFYGYLVDSEAFTSKQIQIDE